MTQLSFSLISFPAPNLPEVTITGNILRRNNLLTLRYCLAGNLPDILLPSPSVQPGRKAELWKRTCFEFFLGIRDQPQYWEFNMSPSGDWNVYRMDAYRRVGFGEETRVQRLPFEVREASGSLTLDVAIDLNPILQEEQPLEAGVTAVLQTKDGRESYWALAHPAARADFHRRESFILELAGQNHPAPQSAPGS